MLTLSHCRGRLLIQQVQDGFSQAELPDGCTRPARRGASGGAVTRKKAGRPGDRPSRAKQLKHALEKRSSRRFRRRRELELALTAKAWELDARSMIYGVLRRGGFVPTRMERTTRTSSATSEGGQRWSTWT
jgi:hypothetical protein